MTITIRTDCVTDLIRQYAAHNGLLHTDAETIASQLIRSVLNVTMQAGEIEGIDGRKVALAAARRGLGGFISDVHTTPNSPPPACYTLITVRTEGGLWVSETGYEEVIQ